MNSEQIYKAGYDAGYERPRYDCEAWQSFLSKHPELAVEPEIEAGEGHRWLDAGETIIDGDEFWQPMDGTWEEQRNSTGSPVRHDCVFRRKIEPSRTHTAEEIWKAGYNQASSDVPEFYPDRSWKRNGEPRYGNSHHARKIEPSEPRGLAELIELRRIQLNFQGLLKESYFENFKNVQRKELADAFLAIDLANLEPVPAIPEIPEGYEECDWEANHVPEDWMYLDEALDTPAWMFFPKTWGRHDGERLRESHFYWFKAAGGRMARPKPAPVSEASEAPFVPEFGQKVRLTSLISGLERAGRLAGQSKIDWWLLNDGDDEPQSYEKENWSIEPLPTEREGGEA